MVAIDDRSSWLTLEREKSPPPTMMAEMAVPNTAKMTMDPMFLKKLPCGGRSVCISFLYTASTTSRTRRTNNYNYCIAAKKCREGGRNFATRTISHVYIII